MLVAIGIGTDLYSKNIVQKDKTNLEKGTQKHTKYLKDVVSKNRSRIRCFAEMNNKCTRSRYLPWNSLTVVPVNQLEKG